MCGGDHCDCSRSMIAVGSAQSLLNLPRCYLLIILVNVMQLTDHLVKTSSCPIQQLEFQHFL